MYLPRVRASALFALSLLAACEAEPNRRSGDTPSPDGGEPGTDAGETAADDGDADTDADTDAGGPDASAELDCRTGETRCDGQVVETCDAAGNFVPGDSCDFVCSEGACTGACVPGSTRCDGLVVETCDVTGRFVPGDSCDFVCSDGACTGTCVPGSTRCDGLVVETCDATGSFVPGDSCEFVCTDGACTGTCVPGSTQCDALVVETCDATGSFVPGDSCEFVCAEGACTGECVPESLRCSGLVIESCDAAGSYVPGDSCDFVCSQGACSGVCVPGAVRCSDSGDIETCDATGAFVVTTDCAQTCAANACTCAPGYAALGASCTPLDFCDPDIGGCAPDATCSQSEITPACACDENYQGTGLECHLAATSQLDEGFEDISMLLVRGWLQQLNSQPVGSTGLFQGTAAPTGPFNSYDGAANAYIGANYNNTGSTGTISTWLATPLLDFGEAGQLSFYTRSAASQWVDRLEVRLCRGAACALPTGSATTTAGYDTLLMSINPTLVAGGYPNAWTQFSATDLPTSGKGRIAFRYYVTSAGSLGTSSDYIGIDRVQFSAASPSYQVGGSVTGVTASGLKLSLNGQPPISIDEDGDFAFTTKLSSDTPYTVYLYGAPAGSSCTLTNASGTVSDADVTDVEVACL